MPKPRRRKKGRWEKRDPAKPYRLNPEGQRSYVYLLQSSGKTRGGNPKISSYVGFTVSPLHRLRQHRHEITGGPPKTKWTDNHRMLFVISADPSWFQQRTAMWLEWRFNAATKNKYMTKFPEVKGFDDLGTGLDADDDLKVTRVALLKLLRILHGAKQWTSASPTYDASVHKMRYFVAPELLAACPNLSHLLQTLTRWSGSVETLDLATILL